MDRVIKITLASRLGIQLFSQTRFFRSVKTRGKATSWPFQIINKFWNRWNERRENNFWKLSLKKKLFFVGHRERQPCDFPSSGRTVGNQVAGSLNSMHRFHWSCILKKIQWPSYFWECDKVEVAVVLAEFLAIMRQHQSIFQHLEWELETKSRAA